MAVGLSWGWLVSMTENDVDDHHNVRHGDAAIEVEVPHLPFEIGLLVAENDIDALHGIRYGDLAVAVDIPQISADDVSADGKDRGEFIPIVGRLVTLHRCGRHIDRHAEVAVREGRGVGIGHVCGIDQDGLKGITAAEYIHAHLTDGRRKGNGLQIGAETETVGAKGGQ